MVWELGLRERIRTSQWPGDWTVERIRTSLDLDSVERIRTSQWLGDKDPTTGLTLSLLSNSTCMNIYRAIRVLHPPIPFSHIMCCRF